MRIIKLLFFLIILTSGIGCAGSKAKKYLKEGKTVQTDFKTIIPFEMKNGFIILKVEIKDKPYDFLLDTGASSVISTELAKELAIKTLGSELIYDIYNIPQTIEYGRINNIRIGNIDFIETVSAIVDFNTVQDWSCLEIDGFIGSNLMQHAIWDFDFNSNLITITNDESKLNLPKDIIKNKLFIGYAGIPSVVTKINGNRVWNNTIDFGFNGRLNIPFAEFEEQRENGTIQKIAKAESLGVTGIYGQQSEIKESYLLQVETMSFGDAILKNQIVASEKHLDNLLGLDFFKDYRVILNWKYKTIKLISQKSTSNLSYKTFGFSYSYKDNGLFVSTLFEKTKAKDFLKIGDKILSIDENEYYSVSDENYCSILADGLINEVVDEIEIKILRDEKELIFELEKEILLD